MEEEDMEGEEGVAIDDADDMDEEAVEVSGQRDARIVNITKNDAQTRSEQALGNQARSSDKQGNDPILVVYNQQQAAQQQMHEQRRPLPKKPHSAGYLLQPPYDQARMAQNRSQQAPKKNLGVVYNAPVGPLFNQPLQPQQQAQTQDALKRKKMREMIFGARAPGAGNQYNSKEDIANHYRNLKIKTNITLDENMRLKTKVQ